MLCMHCSKNTRLELDCAVSSMDFGKQRKCNHSQMYVTIIRVKIIEGFFIW